MNTLAKLGQSEYPKLKTMAMEFLYVCANSIAFQPLFSVGPGIITYKRVWLVADAVSMLMMMKCWAREDDLAQDIHDEVLVS